MAKQTLKPFEPDYAVPPGNMLQDTLEALNMSPGDLAARTGLTEQTITRILNGTHPINPDTAQKLEAATGVPVIMWTNLEAQYRQHLSKARKQARKTPHGRQAV